MTIKTSYIALAIGGVALLAGIISAWPPKAAAPTMEATRQRLGLPAPRPVPTRTPRAPVKPNPLAAAPDEDPPPTEDSDNDVPTSAPEDWLNRPRRLTRHDIEVGMARIEGNVLECKHLEEATGTVTVRIEVSTSGNVTSALVLPPFAETKTGQCVAHAARGASFPSFSPVPTPTISITYPYYFQAAE